jgi:dolichol-phosphate mannosyltransferase
VADDSPLVTVVVAMFNEEDSLPQLIQQLGYLNTLKPLDWNFEYVFVDDGSRDRTLAVVQELTPPSWKARIVQHQRNMGFGAGLRSGIDAASGDVIVSYDADCTYPIADTIGLVQHILAGSDCATADPFLEGQAADVPIQRMLLSRGNSLLYRLVVGSRARNLGTFSCAFRAYRASTIKACSFSSNGFGAASEILGRLVLSGAKIGSVSSNLSTRRYGQSKMRVARAIREHISVLSQLFRYRLHSSQSKSSM